MSGVLEELLGDERLHDLDGAQLSFEVIFAPVEGILFTLAGEVENIGVTDLCRHVGADVFLNLSGSEVGLIRFGEVELVEFSDGGFDEGG